MRSHRPAIRRILSSSLSVFVLACCALVPAVTSATEAGDGNGYVNAPPPPVNDDPPMLGVQMTNTNARVQRQQNLNPGQGILVRNVYSDTAADQLGVQSGDVILDINGSNIGSMSDLRSGAWQWSWRRGQRAGTPGWQGRRSLRRSLQCLAG